MSEAQATGHPLAGSGPEQTGRRATAVRHEVRGSLEAVTALRVGGWGASPDADLVAARDGLGRLVIPGTSLAGAMRAWLGSATGDDGSGVFDPGSLRAVFGDLERPGLADVISRITVDDATADADAMTLIRDGVGIDRVTGSAAAGVLYQHEVVPPGTRFAVRITASQTAADAERVAGALDLLVGALAGGQVELGAARTRGLGQVRLTGVRRTRVDLADRDQVLRWLTGMPAEAPASGPATGAAAATDGRLGIEITWTAVTPVMVRASTVNEPEPDRDRAVDTVPLRTIRIGGEDGGEALLLPGSSIKGVLRFHAERVVRTLLGFEDVPDRWLHQVNDDRLDPVAALFGVAGDHRDRSPAGQDAAGSGADGAGHQATNSTTAPTDTGGAAARPRAGRRGALSVQDCLGAAERDRVVTHVAVDRWTGGAAENLLFSVAEPVSARWEPITMRLDVRRSRVPGDENGARALALLLLVLRDLADGWLPLGFGGTRGRGSVSVSQVTFTGSGLPAPWSSLPGRTLAELTGDPPEQVSDAFAAWHEAVTA